jgi:hypothetical protein
VNNGFQLDYISILLLANSSSRLPYPLSTSDIGNQAALVSAVEQPLSSAGKPAILLLG